MDGGQARDTFSFGGVGKGKTKKTHRVHAVVSPLKSVQ